MLCSLLVLPAAASAAGAQGVPAWLAAHVGEADGQISAVVLQRARALYREKVASGAVRNPCYFAMDATRPADLGNNRIGRRFYIICEAQQSFRAVSAGHGSGRKLPGLADFSNGRQCVKNFGNASDSELTTGGDYVTAETRTSFKGYYRSASGQTVPFLRSFVQFDGEGATANARARVIGGHPAEVLRAMCRIKAPGNAYANGEGYVPFGKLVGYAAGRSNGCTSWSPADAQTILPIMQAAPTTLYIYPEARDIAAVAHTAKGGVLPPGSGLYWNAQCLKAIGGAPKFWSASVLEPLIARYKASLPKSTPRPLPICQ
ncbi:hypothetical protein [Jiella sp. M17.18]|uniref:hypothetical protein n=1 Tax=Jiella sp. M17.18 TaxID=3234247 RepID=UPI0034DFABEA